MINKEDLAGDIRKIRKKRGLTQKQLADIMGVSQAMITQYERNKRKPKLKTLERIANALQCSVSTVDGLKLLEAGSRERKDDTGSKAVLLVNMPEKCECCRFYFCFGRTKKCILNHELTLEDKKPDWCPLVPLPEKKELSCEDFEYDTKASAWNSCIDAITAAAKEERQ